MKILKYKKMSNGKYKIFLDDGSELLLYEEVILNYELLLNKEINNDKIEQINNLNLEYDVYYMALKSLNNRIKSTKELSENLLKKQYPKELVEKAISKLLSQGYLDDRSFCKSYINNQIITTSKGPYKISKELINKGVSEEIINQEISSFSEEEQLLKIEKVVNRLLKSNRTRGGAVLRQKITTDLINLGYDITLITKVINNLSFDNNKDIAKKEYDKLYKKLSKKYSGNELEYKIKERLYRLGLYYEE